MPAWLSSGGKRGAVCVYSRSRGPHPPGFWGEGTPGGSPTDSLGRRQTATEGTPPNRSQIGASERGAHCFPPRCCQRGCALLPEGVGAWPVVVGWRGGHQAPCEGGLPTAFAAFEPRDSHSACPVGVLCPSSFSFPFRVQAHSSAAGRHAEGRGGRSNLLPAPFHVTWVGLGSAHARAGVKMASPGGWEGQAPPSG